jgi:hypothetical protein
MTVKNCKYCDKLIDLDTDLEHEEVCADNNMTTKKILKDFTQQFDIDRIKDRSEHEYFEGDEAEERVTNWLKDALDSHSQVDTAYTEAFNKAMDEPIKKLDQILEELALIQIKTIR